MFLGTRDHSNRESREGSMGPPSRQSSNASASSLTSSLQDAGSSGSQFFEVNNLDRGTINSYFYPNSKLYIFQMVS